MSPKSTARLRSEITGYLEDFPGQLMALESAMDQFGSDFDRGKFKRAFDREAGLAAYNQVQAVERAYSRVQNHIAKLSESGVMLAGLELPKLREGKAARAFEALKKAGVIDSSLCRKLKDAQRTRSAIEHDYLEMNAGRMHQSVNTLSAAAREFIGAFAAWIEPYVTRS